uniref:Uncharacterized protein n=1 Tax=Arundo donax TaxID=35708 RepID=A0A0A9GID6_ARUDO
MTMTAATYNISTWTRTRVPMMTMTAGVSCSPPTKRLSPLSPAPRASNQRRHRRWPRRRCPSRRRWPSHTGPATLRRSATGPARRMDTAWATAAKWAATARVSSA